MKCWPGGYAIIANEPGFAQIRVDLLLKWFDIDLVVVNRGTAGESELPSMALVHGFLHIDVEDVLT